MGFIPADKYQNLETDDLLKEILVRLDLLIRHAEEVTDLEFTDEELEDDHN